MPPFGLSPAQLRSFCTPLSEYLPPGLVHTQEFESAVVADLADLAELSDPEVVESRIKKMQVKTPAALMAEQVLFNDGHRIVISGMRYKGLDVAFPFISITTNFRIATGADLEWIKQLTQERYESVSPKGFRFTESPNNSYSDTQTWSAIVAGKTQGIQAPPKPHGLDFRWSSSADFFPEYEAEYKRWSEVNPALAKLVRPEGREDLEQAASDGLLLSVYSNDLWLGAIAGQSKTLFGSSGIYIFELFLAESLRGQGFAKVLQSTFLLRLKELFSYVWGHIQSRNLSSQKTALSVGRKIIQQEFFVPF